uniref:Uncharacterized protein n=1 Tax=Anguilla anguilla TaxID=7936 RepID=A0A0E9VUY1_ANGAN
MFSIQMRQNLSYFTAAASVIQL